MTNNLNLDRVRHLLSPELLKDLKITIVGLGSGGSVVCDHLTMNGVKNWDLFDPDDFTSLNLIKHPRMRKSIGKKKVEIQKQWILDRNPEAVVNAYAVDVFNSDSFYQSLENADLVLCCVDDAAARRFINHKCVNYKISCITGSVFRTGFGGDIFTYIPSKTSCYSCLQLYSKANNLSLPDHVIIEAEKDRISKVSSPEEQSKLYKILDSQVSGLSLDIYQIAIVQARVALAVLSGEDSSTSDILKYNWIVIGNRPFPNLFSKSLEVFRGNVPQQITCYCNQLDEEGKRNSNV